MMRSVFVAALLLALTPGLTAQKPSTGGKPLQKAPLDQNRDYYDFHNSFWTNLHLTLYHEFARRPSPDRAEGLGSTAISKEDLSPEESKAWGAAVQYYKEHFAGHPLVFDSQLIELNNALAQQESVATIMSDGLPSGLAEALNAAAPVYRKHWWAAHQQSNQQWTEKLAPRIREMAGDVVPSLEQALSSHWPEGPDRVDVAYFVDTLGHAFTTLNPAHTTLSSSVAGNQGVDGVEILFHEGAHLFTGHLISALKTECETQKKQCADLWHAVQFYSVGEIVRQELANRGTKDYTPYAFKYGLWDRGLWPKYLTLIKADWVPHLQGKTSFEEAVKALVKDLE